MSEPRSNGLETYDDLRLITEFLNGQLDQERVAIVRRRLEEDPEFLDFAAPLLLAWSVPPEWQRTPRPPGELEKHWDEFTRRSRFVHQRREARKRRLFWLAGIVALLSLGYAARAPLAAAYWRTQFTALSDTVRAPMLSDGTRVILGDSAVLEVHRSVGRDSVHWVRLRGEARFILPRATTESRGSGVVLHVLTREGVVRGVSGEFHVRAQADTTRVTGGAPGAERRIDPQKKDLAYVATLAGDMGVPVSGGEHAWIVRGARAVKAPAALPETLWIAPRAIAGDDRLPTMIDSRAPLPGAGESLTLGMGVKARVHPEAKLSVEPPGDLYPGQVFALEGMALFLVPRDTTSHGTLPTFVRTRGGLVAAAAPVAVRVRAHGDTTDVHVVALVQRDVQDPFTGSSAVMLYSSDRSRQSGQFILTPGQSGRLVKGKLPVIVPNP